MRNSAQFLSVLLAFQYFLRTLRPPTSQLLQSSTFSQKDQQSRLKHALGQSQHIGVAKTFIIAVDGLHLIQATNSLFVR